MLRSKCQSLKEANQIVWTSKVGKRLASAPKLASIETKILLVCIYKLQSGRAVCRKLHLHLIQPNMGGTEMFINSLTPVTVPADVPVAPWSY